MSGQFVIGTMKVKNNAGFTYTGSGSASGNGSSLVNYYPSGHQICVPATNGGTTGTC